MVLIEKIEQLSPQRRAEVEDFVDFLRAREDAQRLTRDFARPARRASRRCGTTTRTRPTTGSDQGEPENSRPTARRSLAAKPGADSDRTGGVVAI